MAHATLIAHICVWASTKKFQNFFSQKENNSFLFLLIFQNFQQQKNLLTAALKELTALVMCTPLLLYYIHIRSMYSLFLSAVAAEAVKRQRKGGNRQEIRGRHSLVGW